MTQELKSTNYLNPTLFYNDFLDYLVLLDEFHTDDQDPPMSANQFYWLARTQYGSALRITEALNLIKEDFDLDHRILTIRNPKTDKTTIQKTTILPYDIEKLRKFLSGFINNERIFPITRSTAWRYYKNASTVAGLNIFEAKDTINIEGAWTNLLRSSCAKMYEDSGAKPSLIQRKLRHRPRNVTDVYTKRDLQALLDWEDRHLKQIPFFLTPDLSAFHKEDTIDKPLIVIVDDN